MASGEQTTRCRADLPERLRALPRSIAGGTIYDEAADEIERLRAALVEHNDMLRAAFNAAQRDAAHDTAGTTNFRLLADRLSETLARHHAITNEAREASDADPDSTSDAWGGASDGR